LRFPSPPGSNKDLTLWGLIRHLWGDVHFWISLGLLPVILLLLGLHWQGIVISVKRRLLPTTDFPHAPLITGLITLPLFTTVLVLFGRAAQSGVEKISEPGEGGLPTLQTTGR
jgi:hypothetical protein